MPHLSPRQTPIRPLLPALAALGLLALTLSFGGPLAAESDAAKRCKGSHQEWQLNGERLCVATPKRPRDASSDAGALRSWIGSVTGPRPTGGPIVPKRTRRGLPKLERLAVKLLARVDSHPRSGLTARSPRSGGGHGPVVSIQRESTGTKELVSGVVGEGHITLREYADGTVTKELDLEMRSGRYSVVLSPILERPDGAAVGCPDASGKVEWATTLRTGGTLQVRRGRTGLRAATQRNTVTTRSRGHVGADARLRKVATDVRVEINHYQRGLQIERTYDGSYSVDRGAGKAVGTGIPKVTARVRAAGATRAEEAEFERNIVKGDLGDRDSGGGVGAAAVSARDKILAAESNWYAIPNSCARLELDPGGGMRLPAGRKASISGRIEPVTGGGSATGRIEVTSVAIGSFAAGRSEFQAGAPARFIATAGPPQGGSRDTVEADLLGTSTAGRAARSWWASGGSATMPTSFSGTLSASTVHGPGMETSWSGTGTFTRTSLAETPDGSTYAWYGLSDAALTSSVARIGLGCYWEAKGGAGTIDAGTLEIRVLPNGERRYAILYVLSDDVTYHPVGCPPGATPFEGEINAHLHTRRPGQPDPEALRTAPADYHLSETGVSDVQPASDDQVTTASWDLTPSASG